MKYMHKYNSKTQMFADWDDAMDVITPGFYGENAQGPETGYCEYLGFSEDYGFAWDVSDAAPGYSEGYTDKRNVSDIDYALDIYGTYGAGVITPVRAQGNGGPWVSYTEEPGTATWNIKVRKGVPVPYEDYYAYHNKIIYYYGELLDSQWTINWNVSDTRPEHLYAWTPIRDLYSPQITYPGVLITGSNNPQPGDTVYYAYFSPSEYQCNVDVTYPNGIKHFYKGIVTYNCK